MAARIDVPEETIRKLYIEEGLSGRQIAKRLGLTHKVIRNRLIEYEIAIREKVEDLTKYQSFGKLVAVRCLGRNRHGTALWLCRCDCGKEVEVLSSNLKNGSKKDCGCVYRNKLGREPIKWYGYEGIPSFLWSRLCSSAARKNRVVEVDLEFLWGLYLSQEGKCAISGISIVFSDDSRTTTASLDRIDSAIGYTKNNVQWVHKDINWMKQDFNQEYFISMCNTIAEKWRGTSDNSAG